MAEQAFWQQQRILFWLAVPGSWGQYLLTLRSLDQQAISGFLCILYLFVTVVSYMAPVSYKKDTETPLVFLWIVDITPDPSLIVRALR